MRIALFLMAVLVLVCGNVVAADKIGTSGAPNSSGQYPLEVFDDRSIVVASDATFTVDGTNSVAALTATSAEIDGALVIDGTIYTATINADGGIKPGASTLDPCATLPAGSIFINNTTKAPCFCNSAGVDLSLYDGTTACF